MTTISFLGCLGQRRGGSGSDLGADGGDEVASPVAADPQVAAEGVSGDGPAGFRPVFGVEFAGAGFKFLAALIEAFEHGTLARARRRAERVAVSIFVNPAQFAPNEDFATYPRTFEADVAALTRLKVDLVWAPQLDAMYTAGFATRIIVKGPAEADLEDRFRPHFFGGVATVVAKLFTQCRPDYAMFGEKDYQQLKTVTRMARDLDLRVEVVGVPTVR